MHQPLDTHCVLSDAFDALTFDWIPEKRDARRQEFRIIKAELERIRSRQVELCTRLKNLESDLFCLLVEEDRR